jgi:hypothetical protein
MFSLRKERTSSEQKIRLLYLVAEKTKVPKNSITPTTVINEGILGVSEAL